ncbi:hypothetical protein V8F33_005884 [Rhypophila sp. PSN 637]
MDKMSLAYILQPESQDQASATTPGVTSTANSSQNSIKPGEASVQSITPLVAAPDAPVSESVENPGSQTDPAGAPSTAAPPLRRSPRHVGSQDTAIPGPSHGTSKAAAKGKQPAKGNLQIRCQTPSQLLLQEQWKKDAVAVTQSLPIEESFVRGDGAANSEPSSTWRPITQQQDSSSAVISASPATDVQLSEQEKKILAIGKSNNPLASAKEYYLETISGEALRASGKVPAGGPKIPKKTLELAAGQILSLVEQMTPKLEERIKKAEEARREANGDAAVGGNNGAPACSPTIATTANDQGEALTVKQEDSNSPEEQLLPEIPQSHGKADSDALAESTTEVGNTIRPKAEVAVVKAEEMEFGLGPAIVIDAKGKGLATEVVEDGCVESLPGSIDIREAETGQLEPGLDGAITSVERNADADSGSTRGVLADVDVQMAENNMEVGPSPSYVNAVSEKVPVPEERGPADAEQPAAESTATQRAETQTQHPANVAEDLNIGHNYTVATTASIITGSDITIANILGGFDVEGKGPATTEPRIKVETSGIERTCTTEVATREPRIKLVKRKASAVEEKESSSSEQPDPRKRPLSQIRDIRLGYCIGAKLLPPR